MVALRVFYKVMTFAVSTACCSQVFAPALMLFGLIFCAFLDQVYALRASITQAELYRIKKDYTKAEPLYLEAVQRLEHSMGADAPGYYF